MSMSDKPESMQELLERAVRSARARKTPSARNQRIADEVWVNGRTQVEVAAEYRLSQRRISQICQQVEAWQAQTEAWERGQTCGSKEKEVENELQKRQLTEIYRRSMRAFTRSERPLVSRRSRKCAGDEQWSEEHEREQRLDTGSLRVAMRALEQRAKLAPRDHPDRRYTSDRHVQNLEWIVHILSHYRRDAEQRGEVPCGPESSKELVERVMRKLLAGSKSEQKASAEGGTGMLPVSEGREEASGVREHRGDAAASLEARPHQEADASRSPEVAASSEPTTAGSRSRRLDGDAGLETQPSAKPQFDFGEKRLGYFGQTNLRQEIDNVDLPVLHRLACATVLIKQQDALLDRDDNEIELRQQVDDSDALIDARLMAAQMLLKRQAVRLAAAARSSSPRDVEAQVQERVADSGVTASDAAAASCGEPATVEVPAAGSQNSVNRRESREVPAGPLAPLHQPAAAPDPHPPQGSAGPAKLTRIERLLASGRRISPAWRRQLEGKMTRRREHS
jgi:hypothetical protein